MDAPAKVWLDLQNDTTLIGVVKLKEKVVWHRIIWFVVVSFSTALVAFQIGTLLTRFFSFETRSNKMTAPLPINFPAVTICNQNAFKLSQALLIPEFGHLLDTFKAVNNNEELDGNAESLLMTAEEKNKTTTKSEDEIDLYACVCVYSLSWTCFRCPQNATCHYRYHGIEKEAALGNGFSTEDDKIANQVKLEEGIPFVVRNLDNKLVDLLSYNYNELITGCVIGNEICDERLRTFDIKYGRCFSFNFHEENVYKTSRIGADAGLILMVYSNVSDYFDVTETAGVRVTIHGQDTFPFSSIRGHDAAIGMHSTFGIKAMQTNRISYGSQRCLNQSIFPIPYTGGYTTEGCQRTCYQRNYYLQCGCIDARFPRLLPTDHFCNLDNIYQRACLANVTLSIINNPYLCDCPNPCFEVLYSTTISRAPLQDYIGFTKHTKEKTFKDHVLISIYFESLTVEALNEVPSYTFSTLISDLGGTVGFWIGMSLIGFYELVIFSTRLAWALAKYAWASHMNKKMSKVIVLSKNYDRSREINNSERTIVPVRRDWDYRNGHYRSEMKKGLIEKRERSFVNLARILGINPNRRHFIHSHKLFQ